MAGKSGYQPLHDSQLVAKEGHVSSSQCSSNRRMQLAWALSTSIAIICSLLVGFLLGQRSIPTTQDGLLFPTGNVPQVWQHNRSFSAAPSPETEAAWGSIVPVGRGFVHHETIAPFISNIAVFHQLHCLHGLRVAYYTALDNLEVLNGTRDKPDDYIVHVGARVDAHHIQHCYDYLRRAIMCAADTNLEYVSRKTRETNGWGVERVCRDYESVKAWAEKYANSTDTGIL